MGFEKISITGFQKDNLGAGYLVFIFMIDDFFQMPNIRNLRAGGTPTFGENTLLIEFNGTFMELSGSMKYKDGAELWEYEVAFKLPKNELEKLRKIRKACANRFVMTFYPMNIFGGVDLTEIRLLGDKENSCRLTFDENYGDSPKNSNHYRLKFTCNLAEGAPFI